MFLFPVISIYAPNSHINKKEFCHLLAVENNFYHPSLGILKCSSCTKVYICSHFYHQGSNIGLVGTRSKRKHKICKEADEGEATHGPTWEYYGLN